MQAFADGGIDETAVLAIGEARSIQMAENGEDARQPRRRRAVDGGDAAEADAAADDDRIGLVRLVELGSVLRRARHLGPAVDSGKRLSNGLVAHVASPTISKARMTVRRSNSTL
jgi:hypothetical protein